MWEAPSPLAQAQQPGGSWSLGQGVETQGHRWGRGRALGEQDEPWWSGVVAPQVRRHLGDLPVWAGRPGGGQTTHGARVRCSEIIPNSAAEPPAPAPAPAPSPLVPPSLSALALSVPERWAENWLSYS